MNSSSVKSLPENNRQTHHADPAALIECDWPALQAQLMLQWERITPQELADIGPDCRGIARLIERKYGVAARMVETYLRNFEKTLPAAANVNEPV